MSYRVVSIPLNRPEIVSFLLPPTPHPRGAPLHILEQRPTEAARHVWIERLRREPTLAALLSIDAPEGHRTGTATDRLVPTEFLLAEEDYLTRNLGGWAAIYFAVIDAGDTWPNDPLLNHAEVMADFGVTIRSFGPDPALVEARLEKETGLTLPELVEARIQLADDLADLRTDGVRGWERHAADVLWLFEMVDREARYPSVFLLDDLLDRMVRIEQARRAAIARFDEGMAAAIAEWQAQVRKEYSLELMLKGEYIMGRHRRSTVLLAPDLGVVVKQPGLEPFHEAAIGARTYEGKPENWPILTRDGSLVTPAGRIRLSVEEGVIERLDTAFRHPVQLSTLVGIIIEPFVTGPTMQEYVLEDPARMTPDLYEQVVMHQQVCEVLGIENGDWHSANFIMVPDDRGMVHVDWGAARPLTPGELPQAPARLQQVKNIAFSFHDPGLAARVQSLHAALIADEARLAGIRRRAQTVVEALET